MIRPPRVNPFVGLPESSLRFILLALVTLAAAAYAWQYIHQVIHQRSVLAAIETCTKLSLDQPDPPFRNAYSRCWAEQMARPLANSITLGLVLTTAVALACFAVGPVLLRRWRGLRPLASTSAAADLPADVVELAAQLDVAPPPVLTDPRPASSARMVAGGFRRPALVLGSRLLAAARDQTDSVRAVLAHELAHVRNADVWLAELTVAGWWTLALAVLAPYVVSAIAGGYPGSVVVVVAKLLAILLLARLLRNALLRAREVDADIRASTVGSVRTPLEQLLARQSSMGRSRLWSAHPSGADRLRRVTDPTLVLRTAGPDLLALGATIYFLIPGISFWLEEYTYGRPSSNQVMAVVSWVAGAAVGAGVWALAWRAAVAEHFSGVRQPAGLRRAAWLAGGFLLGAFLVPVPRDTLGMLDPHSATGWLSIGAVVLLGCLLVTGTAQATARRLVARAGTQRRIISLNGLGLLIVSGLGALVLEVGRLFVLFSANELRLTDTLVVTLVSILVSPTTYALLLVTVAGLVTSALVRRGGPGTVPDWMVLGDAEGAQTGTSAVNRRQQPE